MSHGKDVRAHGAALVEASPLATLMLRRVDGRTPEVIYANPAARALLAGPDGAPHAVGGGTLARLAAAAITSGEPAVDRRVTLFHRPGRWYAVRAVPTGDGEAAVFVSDITDRVGDRARADGWVDTVDALGLAVWIFERRPDAMTLLELPVVDASSAARAWGAPRALRAGQDTLQGALGEVLGPDDIQRMGGLLRGGGSVPLELRRGGQAWVGHAYARDRHLLVCLRDDSSRGALLATVQQNVALLAKSQADLAALGRALHEHIRPRLSRAQVWQHRLDEALAAGDLTRIRAEVERQDGGLRALAAILDDLQTYAGINSATATNDAVHLAEAVDDGIAALGDRLTDARARIIRGRLPTIWGRSEVWPIVFRHLFDNALCRARPGVPLEVAVEAEMADGEWWVSVRDNGQGIPKRFLDRIFEPLFQVQPSPDAGCGLGLAICRRVVEQHLGTVAADSVVGQGTTITIRLPTVGRAASLTLL